MIFKPEYRIKKVEDADGKVCYYVEQKLFFFFWVNILLGRLVDCYWFYEDAEKEIYRRTFKNKVTYFYPDKDFKVNS
jgi:hypothetical protein